MRSANTSNSIVASLPDSKTIEPELEFACEGIGYWNYYDFKKWAIEFLSYVRELPNKYSSSHGVTWKEFLLAEFKLKKLTPEDIFGKITELKELGN